jgi:hypothetical protein
MQYDWQFARRIRCSSAEKTKCLGLVAELLSLAKKARTYGLLSLLDDVEKSLHPLLQKGLQLIVDGEKPVAVNEILQITILAANNRGRELLEQSIILEGLAGIQNGNNPKTIKEYMLAFLGAENATVFAERFEESPMADMEAFLRSMEISLPSPAPASGLNQTFGQLNDEAIQLCLREISTLDLAKALQGLSAKIQQRIFGILPKRGASTLRDVMDQTGTVEPVEVAEAHSKIESVLADLNQRGLIQYPG